MEAMTMDEVADVRELGRAWWLFLLTGIAWVVVSLVVLTVDPTSAAVIGYLVAFVLLAAGVNEFVTIGFVEGWKWLHAVLGVLFVVGGILALTAPFQTFGILALLIGWYLVFKGTFSVVFSILAREEIELWGLMLAAGIVELVIGVWALGYPGRSAWLLILWVGIGALLRGVTEIVFAFQLRGARRALA
jgi:uncharacterized membrane protein HdeD (DUF308 family)